MSSPLPYLIRMLLFLVAVMGLAFTLHEDLLRVFRNTPVLDSVIVGVLLLGIFFFTVSRHGVPRVAIAKVLMSSAENENGDSPVKRIRYQ